MSGLRAQRAAHPARMRAAVLVSPGRVELEGLAPPTLGHPQAAMKAVATP